MLVFHNLRRGSWLAWANNTAAHYAAITACTSEIPQRQLSTQGLHPQNLLCL